MKQRKRIEKKKKKNDREIACLNLSHMEENRHSENSVKTGNQTFLEFEHLNFDVQMMSLQKPKLGLGICLSKDVQL